jgi:hypothetical protein
MSSAAAVLACALTLLGRSASRMPPIEFVSAPPPGVSSHAEAFVRRDPGTIYLITSAPVFREAMSMGPGCWDQDYELKKLASIIVHEEWHIRHGTDERGAYHAQLTTLLSLGLGPDSRVYYGVVKSMVTVLREQERSRKARALVAARTD